MDWLKDLQTKLGPLTPRIAMGTKNELQRLRPMLSRLYGGKLKTRKAYCRYFMTLSLEPYKLVMCHGQGLFQQCIDYKKCIKVLAWKDFKVLSKKEAIKRLRKIRQKELKKKCL